MQASARSELAPAGLELAGIVVQHQPAQGGPATILDIDRLALAAGSLTGISGPSGSGKTTLLHLVAGLIQPTSGTVRWRGDVVSTLSQSRRDEWRRRNIGFVFQDFHLVPELDIIANILLPTTFARRDATTPGRAAGEAMAGRFGLTDIHKRAGVLSRGEQQRVAVARALLFSPALILADEPTASLDAENAAAVGEALVRESRRLGAALVCVSHDAVLLARMDQCLRQENGRIVAGAAP